MQAIKTMFRSPRFIVGFLMVFAILAYAILVPAISKVDPKGNRGENAYYHEVKTLVAALEAEDDEAIATEIARLRQLAADNDDEILADAAKNLNDVADAVEQALAADETADAVNALEQVKSNRKFPLVNGERLEMKALLEKGDVEGAREEGGRLLEHCAQANAFFESITEAGNDFDAAQEAVDAFTSATDDELIEINAAIEARDGEGLADAVDSLRTQHGKLETQVTEALARTEKSAYAGAIDAANKTAQSTFLYPKDDPPSSMFWFGTDVFSRDLFVEMAYGARTSLMVGLVAGCLATLIGIALGLTAGFVGGLVDDIITILTNTFIVIPGFIILILISIAVGQFREAWLTGLVIGCTAWPWTARSVRAQTVSLRLRDHVNMARITGYSTAHIIVTEIMPYLMSYIVMAFILQVAGGIGQEATLALLGLGDPTGISLGRLMNWALEYNAINYNRWWEFIPVACAIGMITFGLYLMNSGMDQVFNPKIRS